VSNRNIKKRSPDTLAHDFAKLVETFDHDASRRERRQTFDNREGILMQTTVHNIFSTQRHLTSRKALRVLRRAAFHTVERQRRHDRELSRQVSCDSTTVPVTTPRHVIPAARGDFTSRARRGWRRLAFAVAPLTPQRSRRAYQPLAVGAVEARPLARDRCRLHQASTWLRPFVWSRY
jgi:hypothetical protein